ncbi:MAG: hypothetical protein GX181_03795 [Synergistaceae bacterium]|nr:type II secretion system protein GspM [Synergistota bacterium]NLM71070.1 hypothetical protein [Synergistaceae bacterium]
MRLPSALSPGSLLAGLDGSAWKKRAFYIFLFGLLAWGAAFSFWSDARDLRMRRSLQSGRFDDLIAVLRECSSLNTKAADSVDSARVEKVSDGELLTTVSNMVGELGMRSNMVSLSSAASRGGRDAVSVTLEGITAEKLATFIQEMERRGIVAFSADVRAVRGKDEVRTLTVYLLLGGAQ